MHRCAAVGYLYSSFPSRAREPVCVCACARARVCQHVVPSQTVLCVAIPCNRSRSLSGTAAEAVLETSADKELALVKSFHELHEASH